MEIAENHVSLDRAEVVLALNDLAIKRIIRSYEFRSPTHYVMRTHVLFQNLSKYDCHVVPGEFYKKEIFIDFKAYDRNNVEGILIPSDKNDILLIKYIFLRMIDDIERRSLDPKSKLEAKKRLFYLFTNQKRYSTLDHISRGYIVKALNMEFQGPLASGFFDSMWEGTKSMTDYLNWELTKDLKIVDICSSNTKRFILRFDDYFLQLILLKNPIARDNYSTLTLETERFRSSQKRFYRLSEELKLSIGTCPLLPRQEKSTFHYMIKPPKGIQLRRSPYLKHILKPPRSFLSLREKIINPKCFDILHTSSSERCTDTLESLKIFQQSAKRSETLKEIFAPKKEDPSSDIRAQIKNNLIFLYFRSPRKGDKVICNKNHEVKIRMGLERGGVCFFHYLLMFFLLCMFFLCLHWFLEIHAGSNLEIPSSFWTFTFFVIAQSISVIFDYFRRNDAQRYFMRFNISIILLLIVAVIFLLLAIVALPLF
ncbi:MAG: hypothetical protein KAT49_00860 [Methanomicrobia archaeon]|nr:hypothetical protein [Methanomicrobia archaeon]